MKRFKSAGQAQRFLSVHDQIVNLFHLPRPERQPAVSRRVIGLSAKPTFDPPR